jgi:hypothetical protein
MFFIDEDFEIPPQSYAEVVEVYEIYFDRLGNGKIKLNKAGLYMFLPKFMIMGVDVNEIDTLEKLVFCLLSGEYHSANEKVMKRKVSPINWHRRPVPDDAVEAAEYQLVKALDQLMWGTGTKQQLDRAHCDYRHEVAGRFWRLKGHG